MYVCLPTLRSGADYLQEATRSLPVIHVAGTNGKGSTCAFIQSLLMTTRNTRGFPSKIGLYTSPHLSSPRERIRINGTPILESEFSQCFLSINDRLTVRPGPRYLQMLMLMSVYAFARRSVDVAIYETHCGGEYDSTNIFCEPVATGVTSIGWDHAAVLGPNIEDIAWHKGGIFKASSPAFTVTGNAEIFGVLEQRAVQRGATLIHVGPHALLASSHLPMAQKSNFALSIALTNAFFTAKGEPALSDKEILTSLAGFNWAGRFQCVERIGATYYLDCAHNEMGLVQAAHWFARRLYTSGGYDLYRPTKSSTDMLVAALSLHITRSETRRSYSGAFLRL